MNDKITARIKRGQISQQDEVRFSEFSNAELLVLLNDTDAQKRTAAARILGKRKSADAVPPLCERLKLETALYTRIAISEALGAVGEPALAGLIGLLGQAGSNQHQTLPLRGFYKKSYPLPRDIAARAILKIGRPALPLLAEVVRQGERSRALEAVDCLGHISFYSHDQRYEVDLMAAYEKYGTDEVMQWKIVRAFQAFASAGVQRLLAAVICSHDCTALRWEAARSLGQLDVGVPGEVLDCALQDRNEEVRHMARLFLSARI